VIECVINVSEGRDMAVLRKLAEACGPSLIDVHADADHHRSVFTLAGPGPRGACDAARELALAVARTVSIIGHEGEHPRAGALDVVPFVALGGTNAERAQAASEARGFAAWWGNEHDVPVFLYDEADPKKRDLPHARTHGFKSRAPDFGPDRPDPRLGATMVGARRPLVAINCVLVTRDISVARRIARSMRERDGGLRGVRALGFFLADTNRAQVSMNLTSLRVSAPTSRASNSSGWCRGASSTGVPTTS
jgi:glutamate formiminotransferase